MLDHFLSGWCVVGVGLEGWLAGSQVVCYADAMQIVRRKNSHRVTFTLSAEEHWELMDIVSKRGMTASEVLRAMVRFVWRGADLRWLNEPRCEAVAPTWETESELAALAEAQVNPIRRRKSRNA